MQTVSKEYVLRVAGEILDLAVRSGLHDGSRLPTERELSQRLQLTRTTIRNSMSLLEDEGIVSREVGRGTFLLGEPRIGLGQSVGQVSSPQHALTLAISPLDVMSARQMIEPAAMVAIVESATMNDFEEIERCLRGSESAQDYDEVERWDLALHHALIRASHNPLLESMYLLIDEARRDETWGNLKRRSDSPERRERYRQQHRAIAEAVRDRDGRGAHLAMRAHLDTVGNNLQASAQD